MSISLQAWGNLRREDDEDSSPNKYSRHKFRDCRHYPHVLCCTCIDVGQIWMGVEPGPQWKKVGRYCVGNPPTNSQTCIRVGTKGPIHIHVCGSHPEGIGNTPLCQPDPHTDACVQRYIVHVVLNSKSLQLKLKYTALQLVFLFDRKGVSSCIKMEVQGLIDQEILLN